MDENQLFLFPQLPEFPLSCACSPERIGSMGPAPPPLTSGPVPPPPRKGFAILGPAPPKLKPAGLEAAKPRADPTFAASRRSLTAISWASNLYNRVELTYGQSPFKEKILTYDSPPSTSLGCRATDSPDSVSGHFVHLVSVRQLPLLSLGYRSAPQVVVEHV